MTLAMGSHLSAQRKKKKKKRGNQSGWGAPRAEACFGFCSGWLLGLGPRVRPSDWLPLLFLFCNFFYFLFSISFITFAKILQFKSNFFQKFSKGVHIILSQ
jgi:hypothetical protein